MRCGGSADNTESLLTESGHWRNDRWAQVVGALTGHAGLGRVILTSRQVAVRLTGLQVERVDALSTDEALLLVRELPNLQVLGRGEVSDIDKMDARRLARRAIEAAQGHPKLLELPRAKLRSRTGSPRYSRPATKRGRSKVACLTASSPQRRPHARASRPRRRTTGTWSPPGPGRCRAC
jgi:hypothetical protein